MKRYFKCFAGVLPFLAAVGIQLFVSVFLNVIYMLVIGIHSVVKSDFGGREAGDIVGSFGIAFSRDITYLISVIAIIVCGIVFFFWYRFEIRGESRGKLNQLFTVKNVSKLIFLGIGGQFLISGIMGLIEPFFREAFEKYAETMETLLDGNDIVVLLLLVLVAPIAEELVFRGMVLHKVNRVLPFWVANLFQAVFFGVYHWNFIQGIYAAVLGYLLGLMYRKFKTIYAPIFLHMMFNASSLIMMFIPEVSYINVLLVSIGAVLSGLTIYLLMPFTREDERFPVIEFKTTSKEIPPW